jgi:predicted kinase
MYLTLVRGLPGSGKSTLAEALAAAQNAAHVEADQFYTIDGEYRFDPELRADAHAWAQGQAAYWLARGRSVVVANTFTTMEEMKPYLLLAERFGAQVQVVTVELPGVSDFALAARSMHDVPVDVIDKMRDRWEPFHWEQTGEAIRTDYDENGNPF